MRYIFVVGTADTKGEEIAYLAQRVSDAGGRVLKVDVGLAEPGVAMDVAARIVADAHPLGADWLLGLRERGAAVAAMAEAFARYIAGRNDIAGIVGLGGGGGTSIVTAGMQQLPLGLPKIMVTTLAAGDLSRFVGVSDITVMPSVTDLAGLNALSRVILNNAAQAIAAMANHAVPASEDKPALALTMFGVTTPCVTAIARALGGSYDCLVFHASGVGGRTVEKLVDAHAVSGVIDITTTEVCDLMFGGVMPAGEDRFGAIARTGLPCVMSVGALDMINFWQPDSIPAQLVGRHTHRHNANITLMRTTRQENAEMGRWIGDRLNRCEGPLRLLLPEKGVSALDIEGGVFFDPQADAALFDALEETIEQTPARRVIRLPLHINDPAFSAAAVTAYREISPN